MLFRTSLLLLLLSTLLFSDVSTKNFTVKIAVVYDLKLLKSEIKRLPPALRETIKISHNNRKHFAYTLPTSDKKILQKLLPAYRKIFKDAYISHTTLK